MGLCPWRFESSRPHHCSEVVPETPRELGVSLVLNWSRRSLDGRGDLGEVPCVTEGQKRALLAGVMMVPAIAGAALDWSMWATLAVITALGGGGRLGSEGTRT